MKKVRKEEKNAIKGFVELKPHRRHSHWRLFTYGKIFAASNGEVSINVRSLMPCLATRPVVASGSLARS